MCPSCLPPSEVLAGVAPVSGTGVSGGGCGGYGSVGGGGCSGGIWLCMDTLAIGGNIENGCGSKGTMERSTDPTGRGDAGQIRDITCPGWKGVEAWRSSSPCFARLPSSDRCQLQRLQITSVKIWNMQTYIHSLHLYFSHFWLVLFFLFVSFSKVSNT